jgi:hypothetical protein
MNPEDNGCKSGYDLSTTELSLFIEKGKSMPEQEYIIEALLPKEQLLLIAGDPWQGKSLENQGLVCAFGAGSTFHGLKLKKCLSLYITWEGSTQGIVERFEILHNIHNPDIMPLIKMMPEPVYIDTSEGKNKFREYIKHIKKSYPLEVILLDSFPYTCKGDYRKDKVIDQWFTNMMEISRELGITPIVVYECRKLTSYGQAPEEFFTLERLKGAKTLAYKAYSVVMIGEEKKQQKTKGVIKWMSAGHKLAIVKAKDAKGAFVPLSIKLNRNTLQYTGQSWYYDDTMKSYLASDD